MFELLISVVLLAVIASLAITIILLLSNLGSYFTKIAQGTTVFITAGGNLQEILPNVGGYKMSNETDPEGQRWLVPETDEGKRISALFHNPMPGTLWFQEQLWKKFGVKFISWFWPHTRVHKFDIRKGGRRRIEARNEVALDAPLRSRVIDSPGATSIVDSLLFLVPRPVYVEGIELAGDNAKINLLVLPVFRQVIPSLPVFNLKGDFFTLLDAAVEAAIVDFCAQYKEGEEHLTYARWLKLAKAGEESPLGQRLRRINVSQKYISDLKSARNNELVSYIEKHNLGPKDADVTDTAVLAKMIPSGIIPRFGFALVSFRIVEWEPHKDTQELAKALLAKETESHAAEGVRQKAFGERDAAKARAEGDASRYELPLQALTSKGVHADVAAGVILTQLRTENIRDSKITTYVEGGGTPTSVMIPTSSPTPLTK